MTEKIAVTLLWHGAEVVMEERWVDTEEGRQETRYAFPGGKIEDGETDREAAVREVHEETGLLLDPNKLTGPEIIEVGDDEGHMFEARLPHGTKLQDGTTLIWTRRELLDNKQKGKLLPLTDEYVERHF